MDPHLQEDLAKRNAELETLLAEKERELEIEAALERVQSVAMAMKEPADMLEVCRTIAHQLEALHVKDIRNVQTAIFYESKGTYMNYEYYAKHDKTFITETSFTNHAMHQAFAAQMLKGKGEFFTRHMSKDELPAWIAYQKTTNVFIDTYLETASSVSYYWHSLGPVALGISTYIPLNEEDKALFKRFLNVFELSYTRYLDIENAEAQAREAQIQLALERVRARTMAMQKSDELSEVVYVLFQQFKDLGENPDQATIGVINEEEKVIEYWVTMYGSQINKVFKFSMDEPNVTNKIYAAWKENKKSLMIDLSGTALTEFMSYRASKGGAAVKPEEKRRIINVAFFSKGLLNVQSNEKRSEESIKLLERFASVFDQTYTRFLDLQNAEAQARESQIQLALERVRARTMAMQRSNELYQVARVVFEQMNNLSFDSFMFSVNLYDKATRSFECISSSEMQSLLPQGSYHIPYLDHPFHRLFVESQEEGVPYKVLELSGETKKTYDQLYFTLTDWKSLAETTKQMMMEIESCMMSCAYMSYGSFTAIGDKPLSNENAIILQRFAKVFEQTYTRFLDLQNAETQARESQIQLALERVRARTMAMQRSDELQDAAMLLFQQVEALGAPSFACGFNIWDDDRKTATAWMAGNDRLQPPFKTSTAKDIYPSIYKAEQNGESLFIHEQAGQELEAHYEYLTTIPEVKAIGEELLRAGLSWPKFQVMHCAFFSQGYLMFITYKPVPEAHDIFKRFAKVFEQTYTRFLDLKTAEAQARESQIQLALERVRARTMAMHKSEELAETAQVLFYQLTELGGIPDRMTVGVVDETAGMVNFWLTDQAGSNINTSFKARLDEPTVIAKTYRAWKDHQRSLVIDLHGDDLKKWIQFVREEMRLFVKDEFIKDRRVHSSAFFSQGWILVTTHEPQSEETVQILERFASVFNLTYTRFLDLQKAEAQTREAEIELALERVRAKTMAMQHHSDMLSVTTLLAQQLVHLGFDIDQVNFSNNGLSEKDWDLWICSASMSPDMETSRLFVPWIDHPYFQKAKVGLENYKQRGVDLNVGVFNKEEKNSFMDHIFANTVYRDTPAELREAIYSTPGYTFSAVFLKDTWVSIGKYEPKPFTDEQHVILRRFANAFGQAYTRFLDLQRAEAQAREAQIEAALERVRSRSLAMHKSDELKDVVHTIFEKLKELNVDLYTAIIFIFVAGSEDFVWWLANKANQQYSRILVPYADNPYLKDIINAKENGIDFFSKSYSYEEKNELLHHLFDHTDFKYAPEEQKQFLFGSEFATMSVALTKHIGINITSYSRKSFSDSDNEILKRLARVFDQAYTRFLDLQTAEAQAREAQIEAALERVRSRSVGMLKSEELREVIQIVFEQLRQLNFNIDSAHFNLNFKESDDYNLWSAAPGQPYPVKTHIPYFEHPVFTKAREAKEKGLDFFTESYTKEEKNAFFEHLFKHTQAIPEERRKYILSTPGVAASTVLMNSISLWIMNYSGIPYSDTENTILKRFGKIFEQSYTRFTDLKKAEIQALEAIKRASVDRVRAEIASMRTTNDLERITPLIWNELTTLGVPFIRCGVFIMDEALQQIETHLSTPAGEAIATFNLPYNAPGVSAEMVAHWHKKELYKQHWNEAQFVEFTQNLVLRGAITSGEKYLTENHPTDLYLHFLPFLQGMLYAGNTSPLNNDELQLMQNLADAFSTAYARYEDFNKLETAKKQVDSALNKLQATQKQLIQSEKMASLGELTAGIAHEIQNPLNFVNNFSEVNSELISELVDEVDKGNYEEVKVIAVSLKENEEKINLHGKRADAIVKGMLQHSKAGTGQKEPTDINVLCDEYLRLSYHGLRAKDKSFNATMKTDFDESLSAGQAGIGKISIVPQDIGRVLLNLFNNAFYAVKPPNPLKGENYVPTVSVITKRISSPSGAGGIEIRVKDNGTGIPQNIVDKIFQPFFTTKPTGKGTGLGLSLAYDIIKAHGGEIKVETTYGEGSDFIVQLPL